MLNDVDVKLGDKVIDMVTGFEGLVTAICFYLNGGIDIGVTPKTDNPRDQSKVEYVSLQYIRVIGKGEWSEPIAKAPIGFVK